jgi:hypothetical protein
VRATISLKPIALHRKVHTIRTIEARASCTGEYHTFTRASATWKAVRCICVTPVTPTRRDGRCKQ